MNFCLNSLQDLTVISEHGYTNSLGGVHIDFCVSSRATDGEKLFLWQETMRKESWGLIPLPERTCFILPVPIMTMITDMNSLLGR